MRSGPAWFDKKLDEVGEPGELAVTWNAHIERWQVWVRAPRICNKFVQGWNLLFVVKDDDGGYAPLDERVLARLYSCSLKRFPSAKAYFAQIERQMEREREAAQKHSYDERLGEALERFDHSKIRVGYGPSSGSKFTKWHS